MYDYRFVKSKTKVRERIKAGEINIQDFKEYDDFLTGLCKWMEDNYKTIGGQGNTAVLKDKLLKYKLECGNNIIHFLRKVN